MFQGGEVVAHGPGREGEGARSDGSWSGEGKGVMAPGRWWGGEGSGQVRWGGVPIRVRY